MRVKICGITTLDDALDACEAGADALGFNFADEARARGRYIEPAEAARIIQQLPPFVTTVGICVDSTPAQLLEFLKIVDLVQLHGSEPIEWCEAVYPRAIKAFRIGPGFQVASLSGYPVRACLVDALVPGAHGGTGRTCDWPTARAATACGKPVILAGGLTPENVAEAVRAVRPYGVDTATGVEQSPGRKDPGRMRQFVQNAKRALQLHNESTP